MVTGFASLLSAQTMFPVLSNDEMAGHYEENDVSTLVRQGRMTGPDGAWAAIAARVAAIPEYQARFQSRLSRNRRRAGHRLHRYLERHCRLHDLRFPL